MTTVSRSRNHDAADVGDVHAKAEGADHEVPVIEERGHPDAYLSMVYPWEVRA